MCSENAFPSIPPDAFNSKGFYINYIARILNYIFFGQKCIRATVVSPVQPITL